MCVAGFCNKNGFCEIAFGENCEVRLMPGRLELLCASSDT